MKSDVFDVYKTLGSCCRSFYQKTWVSKRESNPDGCIVVLLIHINAIRTAYVIHFLVFFMKVL